MIGKLGVTALAVLFMGTGARDGGFAVADLRELREEGPRGVDTFLRTHREAFRRVRYHEATGRPLDTDEQRLVGALDALCQQRDCLSSRLYWYTDLEKAKAEAQRSGKPILSLRLLGNLTDELSCANSRFFRASLYADPEISAYLREHFVLHWKSVRPVPVVTIDFGDGRTVKRTVTGNSIHYVLDAEGRVVDALPGLHGPNAFLDWIEDAETEARVTESLAPDARGAHLRGYHEARRASIGRSWGEALRRVGVEPPSTRPEDLERMTDKATWEKMAEADATTPRIRGAARAIARKEFYPSSLEASEIAETKVLLERPVLRMVEPLARSVAVDTLRNELMFHRRIHEWLAAAGSAVDLEELNERVYTELFLTPSADPWLGLGQ